ncbi:NAD(P)-dependent alcohol dehydrogenase [Actinoplanes sp. NPDC051861]|uniref:NAD(P)-dependent alcohol dehydrogenase n=1 Tax=Actinoplanes sp. NPDC051861 TaxID=3155170 RepID=UPI0034144D27
MRIRAAIVEETGGPFVIRHIDLAEPREDEILVRLTAAGICHTDLIMRKRWRDPLLPMVFGHEGAGVVEATGPSVRTLAAGDSVCLSYWSCGTCGACLAGRSAYCALSALNMSGTRADGSSPLSSNGKPVFGNFFGQSSFATHVIATERNAVKVPASLPPVIAAPLGCSVQTGAGTVLNVLDPEPGQSLIVFGAGSVGLSAVMAAVARQCVVTAVDPNTARLALADELGAFPDISEKYDYAIDTTGRPDVISRALHRLHRQGTLALVGIGGTAELDIMTVMAGGLTVRGVIEGDAVPAAFIPHLIDLGLPVDKLITEYPFDAIEDAAHDAAAGRVVKAVLTFPS